MKNRYTSFLKPRATARMASTGLFETSQTLLPHSVTKTSHRGYSLNILLLGLLVLVFLAAPFTSSAQRTRQTTSNSVLRLFKVSNKFTVTGGAGVAVMNSDYAADNRSTKNLLKSNGFGVTAGLGAIRQITPYLAVFADVDFFKIKGEQTFTLEQKDLSFNASIASATSSLAMNLASRNTLNNFYNRSYQGGVVIVPYVKAGVGLLGYDVSPSKAAPEGAEQKSYPAMALVIPIGGGVRFRLTDQFSLATDLTLYMPSTDFLDNREGTNSYLGNNDKFGSLTIKALYTLPRKSVR